MASKKVGVLISNLGTPSSVSLSAIKRYLTEFLEDPKVIKLPRGLWWLILHGIILRVRPRRLLRAYQSIWTPEGSPLLVTTLQQAKLLQEQLGETHLVLVGMRYGKPSLAKALQMFQKERVGKIILLPLYPQFSDTTAGSTFKKVSEIISTWPDMPDFQAVLRYPTDPGYIEALAQSIESFWATQGRAELLIFSFHGIPLRYVKQGDPYPQECQATVAALAARLKLSSTEYLLTYQSRFGFGSWLKPGTSEVLKNLPIKAGILKVQVVCPGFSADCLETLEEVEQQNREFFLKAGGKSYQYIPALNADRSHIQMMAGLIFSKASTEKRL